MVEYNIFASNSRDEGQQPHGFLPKLLVVLLPIHAEGHLTNHGGIFS